MSTKVIDITHQKNAHISCDREYDLLNRVVMCHPSYMRIEEVINETQERYFFENIDTAKAVEQFKSVVSCLESHHIQVDLLTPHLHLPEQVFTRDLGVVIGNRFLLANLQTEIRKQEEVVLNEWLESQHISFERLHAGTWEGGDVLVDRSSIWVGVGHRTSVGVVEELQAMFPTYEVIPVELSANYLHLDCVMNIVSSDVALVHSPALSDRILERLQQQYRVIDVSVQEQFQMGTNVLALGQGNILSLPQNQEVNQRLKEFGFQVLEVDLSEIIKSGGSFRCITLPIERGSQHTTNNEQLS